MSFHQSPFAPMGSPPQKKSKSTIGTAVVRADLRKQRQRVPIGNLYFGGKTPLPCRWRNDDDEHFEVYFKGRWRTAMSIDFDFPTIVFNAKR